MTQTLEEIITAGMGALELARRAEADKAAGQLAHDLEFERLKLESAKLLIPEALRELAHISGALSSEALVVTLPDGAKVEHIINVNSDYSSVVGHDIFKSVELANNRKSGNGWKAYKWITSDGEVAYWPAVGCESLETALSLAVELYDGRQEVEDTAKRWRKQMEAREKKAAEKNPDGTYCPLSKDNCKGAECAWWHGSMGVCSIKMLAIDRTPDF